MFRTILPIIVMIFMIMIVIALATGLYGLISDRKQTTRTVKALTWRIGLSLVLFMLLFVGFFMGWIKPHGLYGHAQPVQSSSQSESPAEETNQSQ